MDERTLSFLGVRYAYQYQGNLSPNMTKNRHSPEYLSHKETLKSCNKLQNIRAKITSKKTTS